MAVRSPATLPVTAQTCAAPEGRSAETHLAERAASAEASARALPGEERRHALEALGRLPRAFEAAPEGAAVAIWSLISRS